MSVKPAGPALPATMQQLITRLTPTAAAAPMVFAGDSSHHATTLGELAERASRVAAGLRELGVGGGQTVVAQLPHRAEGFVLQLATWLLGAIFVPVVPVYGSAEVEQVLADARPAVFVSQRRWRSFDYASNWAAVSPAVRPRAAVFLDGGPGDALDWRVIESAGPMTPESAQRPDDVAAIIYTSGSTGRPKGVRHSSATLLAEARTTDYRPHRSPDDDYLQVSGAGHIGGVIYPVRALTYGTRTTILDGWNGALAASVVHHDRPASMVCTPFHLQTMVEAAAADGLDLSSLDLVVVGGAPVQPDLMRAADRAGVTVVRSYGMSEHPTITMGDPRDDLEVRARSDGKLTPGSALRLVDEDGKSLGPGQAGEIEVRGPEQFIGYTNLPDEEVFRAGGWFPTGDIGTVDGDGYVTVVDRKKNIIIRGGENLSATEIEIAVGTHPGVAEVSVLGIPDRRYGERVCAVIVPRGGHEVTLESLMSHFLAHGIAKQKVPEVLEVVDALPRTGIGKVHKSLLAEQMARPASAGGDRGAG
jgi:cyclohexanecarboxylate-CoA ligase